MQERVKAIVFFVVVGLIAGFFVYREATHVGEPGIINIGQKAPDFSIKDESGKLVKLSDFRGKVVFLHFWGTWCTSCLPEMPEVEKMYETFKDRKFVMIPISIDNGWDEVHQFYKERNITFPAYLDPGHQIANLYKVKGWPESFIIDGNGNVVNHTWVGHWTDPRMLAKIYGLIQQQETPAGKSTD